MLYLYVSVFVMLIFGPLTWEHKIQKFRFGIMFGVYMLFISIVAISVYCFSVISHRDWSEPDPGYVALDHNTYWQMIGFSFFMFEGIGTVMPIMNACDDKARASFSYLLAGALGTLCSTYILFSELCYYTWGSGLNQSIVM